jgi:hypothetical protein
LSVTVTDVVHEMSTSLEAATTVSIAFGTNHHPEWSFREPTIVNGFYWPLPISGCCRVVDVEHRA